MARTGDIDRIEIRLNRLEQRFDKLEVRIDRLEARLDDRIDTLAQKIETHTKWMIGISLTYGIGIIGVLVTFMVASLN